MNCALNRIVHCPLSILHFAFCIVLLCSMTSCSDDDDEVYPSLISDFVMAQSNSEGHVSFILTDDGQRYAVENDISGMPADTVARAICSYVILQEPTNIPSILVYSITGIPVMYNCTSLPSIHRDPTDVAGVWSSGGYINLHLLPLTQGKFQNWGFIEDSLSANDAGTTTHHLSIYHEQLNDPTSYTGHIYASISPDSLREAHPAGDSILLSINTFKGPMTWHFALPLVH